MTNWMFQVLFALTLVVEATVALAGVDGSHAYREAFFATYPMYEMARLRYAALDDVANPRRHDLHAFNHLRQLLDHTARTVTGPNNDTLYSSARLDLRHGPVIVETPHIVNRYYSVQIMNFYTDNLAILGSRSQGAGPLKIALVGPDWTGDVPAHTHRVNFDTNDLWLLVRILVDDAQDIAAVTAIQNALRIHPPRAMSDYPKQTSVLQKKPDPEQFLSVVNEFLGRNPPQGEMKNIAQAARSLGIIPGDNDAWASLPEATRQGWKDIWPSVWADLMRPTSTYTQTVQGWEYPPHDVGRWNGNHLLRATVALRGIAALDPAEAMYISTYRDSAGEALTGQHRYRVKIPPGGLPVSGFWSLSLYEVGSDGRFFFAENPIRRYSISNRTPGLVFDDDGALELVIQHMMPTDARNWLPAPAGPFRLTLRAYLPDKSLVDGTAPLPRIERHAVPLGNSEKSPSIRGTVTAGVTWRDSERNPDVLNLTNAPLVGATGTRPGGRNADDGNLNFSKGDPVSSVVKVFVEGKAQTDDLLWVVSAKGWYDATLERDAMPWGHMPNGYVAGARLSDAGADLRAKFSGASLQSLYVEKAGSASDLCIT